MRNYLVFLAGALVGLVAPRSWAWLLLRLTPPKSPANLITMAEEYIQQGEDLLELGEVLRRLAQGEDPEEIEASLSPRLKEHFDDWLEENWL